MVTVRIATPGDAQGILDIYSPYILSTAFTFESEVPSLPDFQLRIDNCLQRYPWLVCIVDGLLAGYAYASAHRERTAYQWSCECSVYVQENFRGRRLGKELYAALFQVLKLQGLRNVYAGITLPNDPSISLHEGCGFEHFATYEHVGYKLGSWQKVGWWRLLINDLEKEPAPPIKFSQMNLRLLTEIVTAAAQKIHLQFT